MEPHAESASARVARVSRWMAGICVALVIALPIAVALMAFLDPDQVVRTNNLAAAGITSLDRNGQFIVCAVGIVFSLPLLWGLLQLRGLFLCYAAGEVFSRAASRFLSRFAFALLLDALATMLGQTAQFALLTMNFPPGHRTLQIGIGSDQIGVAFIGVTLMVVAWVMAEAATVADENRSFL